MLTLPYIMSNRYFPSFGPNFTVFGLNITRHLVHLYVFMFYPSPGLFLMRVLKYSLMEGHKVNTVVVAEVQWTMFLEVQEGAGVVDPI